MTTGLECPALSCNPESKWEVTGDLIGDPMMPGSEQEPMEHSTAQHSTAQHNTAQHRSQKQTGCQVPSLT